MPILRCWRKCDSNRAATKTLLHKVEIDGTMFAATVEARRRTKNEAASNVFWSASEA